MLTKAEREGWVSALRSGITQGHGHLTECSNTNEDRTFCCLGALAHYVLGVPFTTMGSAGYLTIDMGIDTDILSDYTLKLGPEDPHYNDDDEPRGQNAFIRMNDSFKWSFNRIANIVEHLPTID